MKKVIYFYGPAQIKKYGGLGGVKAYARSNNYLLRDSSLSSVDGQIEQADEYKGDIPKAYLEFVKTKEDVGTDKTETADQTPVGVTTDKKVDPTA